MSHNQPIFAGDIGTIFELTIEESIDGIDTVVNVSSATTRQLIFRKPDQSVLTKTASFTTDGTDGKIRYVTAPGDIDTAGQWIVQGKVVMPSGTFYSSMIGFKVSSPLT